MTEIKEYLQKIGKRGGQKTALLHGKEHFKKIAKGWPKGKKRKPVVSHNGGKATSGTE